MKQQLISFILSYFRFFAKIQLQKNKPLIIGITGSAGKTSTMDTVNALLKDKRNIKVGYGANSETGIPLNIIGLKPRKFSMIEWLKLMFMCPIKLITNWEKYDTYIAEMGIDSPDYPKNMGYLLTIVKPDIGIILNAAPMHSEPFDYLVKETNPEIRAKIITNLIAVEKGRIVTQLNKDKTAIINADQTEILDLKDNISAKIFKFGTSSSSDVKATSIKTTLEGTIIKLEYENEKAEIRLKGLLLPEHFKHTFAATICVGISLGMNLKEAAKEIERNFKLAPGRSSLIRGINDSIIIDSSYNSSTKPTIDMLTLLGSLKGSKKIAMLGDIRELGKLSQIEHEKIANKAIKVCDEVILIGPQMKEFALPIIKKTDKQVIWFKNGYEAADYIKPKLNKEDIILIKASQNTLLLEIAVKKLMKYPQQAESLLARRGTYWDKRRAKIYETT